MGVKVVRCGGCGGCEGCEVWEIMGPSKVSSKKDLGCVAGVVVCMGRLTFC